MQRLHLPYATHSSVQRGRTIGPPVTLRRRSTHTTLGPDQWLRDAPLLQGPDSTRVRAFVRLAALPKAPPVSLAPIVNPIRDARGRVEDWGLCSDARPDDRAAFEGWRSQYVLERTLGDLSSIRSLQLWVRGRTESAEIAALTSPRARISTRRSHHLANQLDRVAEIAQHTDARCLLLTRAEWPSLLAALACRDSPLLLLRNPDAAIAATRNGVLVQQRETSPHELTVTGWTISPDGSVTTNGPHAEHNLGWSAGAGLLRQLGSGTPIVRATATPLTVGLSTLLTRVSEVAEASIRTGQPLFVSHEQVSPTESCRA